MSPWNFFHPPKLFDHIVLPPFQDKSRWHSLVIFHYRGREIRVTRHLGQNQIWGASVSTILLNIKHILNHCLPNLKPSLSEAQGRISHIPQAIGIGVNSHTEKHQNQVRTTEADTLRSNSIRVYIWIRTARATTRAENDFRHKTK